MEEGSGQLPENWLLTTVGDVGAVRLGRQRSPANVSGRFPTKYVRAANISARGFDLSDVLEMDFTPDERAIYRGIRKCRSGRAGRHLARSDSGLLLPEHRHSVPAPCRYRSVCAHRLPTLQDVRNLRPDGTRRRYTSPWSLTPNQSAFSASAPCRARPHF
jgi:hypothetical protein